MLVGGLLIVFVNKADPDQAAHVRAAWSCCALFALGYRKCLSIGAICPWGALRAFL